VYEPIVLQRLYVAGVRLAATLNRAFADRGACSRGACPQCRDGCRQDDLSDTASSRCSTRRPARRGLERLVRLRERGRVRGNPSLHRRRPSIRNAQGGARGRRSRRLSLTRARSGAGASERGVLQLLQRARLDLHGRRLGREDALLREATDHRCLVTRSATR
jgi:hypothetical protein